MRIGVVSDTHGHVGNTRSAVEMLVREKVETVLHCGDIGSAEVVALFDRWPAHFVFGNCDHDREALADAIRLANQTGHGDFGSINLDGCPVAMVHGHDRARFREAIEGGEFRLVCYGHTHVPEHHYEGDTLVLNPGALFRANPRTIAVVEIPALDVTTHKVD